VPVYETRTFAGTSEASTWQECEIGYLLWLDRVYFLLTRRVGALSAVEDVTSPEQG
jgi:hypothetical protein